MTNGVSSLGPSLLTRLGEVVHVRYDDAVDWLVAVQFRFDEGYLCVEANPGDDTIKVSFSPSRPTPLRFWASDLIRDNVSEEYAGMLGANSVWRWVLQNQQGYQDAFQLELESGSSTTTLQYLVLASRLQLRQVNDVPIT